MKAGDALPVFTLPSIPPSALKAWAGFLRDPNPIHLDVEAVKAKGLGERLINQGPANLAYLVNMLHAAFPDAFLESFDVRYVDNVYAGDTVHANGTIRAIETTGRGQRVTCDLELRVDGRGPAVTGTAVLLAPA